MAVNQISLRGELGWDFPPRPRPKPKKGKKPSSPPQISQLQATASGAGLSGTLPLILVPFWNPTAGLFLINYFDTTNFDCEEDASYYFRMEEAQDKSVTIHKMILTYNNLGQASLTAGITYYSRDTDQYYTASKNIKIGTKIPDFKQHKTAIDLVVTGESPQIFITRKANSGPVSIIRLTIAGHTGEGELV